MSGFELAGPALLFCPADRADRYAKAAAAADWVILDLEDGVAPKDKAFARAAMVESSLDPRRTIVRINAAGTEDHTRDLDALDRSAYEIVMLSKAERKEQIDELAPRSVIALCETPRGVLGALDLAGCANTVALMWGAEDLIASLGGYSSRAPDGSFADPARFSRANVLLAAGTNGRVAIDAVHLDIADEDGLRRQAEEAAAAGFSATACIHPSQVPIVRAAYRPSTGRVDWARRLLEAASSAPGVFRFEGQMIDGPVLRQAERIVQAGAE